MRRTIDDFAEALSVPRDAAEGLLRYLRAVDLAQDRGERPNPSGRGKGARVYEIVSGAGAKVAAVVEGLEG